MMQILDGYRIQKGSYGSLNVCNWILDMQIRPVFPDLSQFRQ